MKKNSKKNQVLSEEWLKPITFEKIVFEKIKLEFSKAFPKRALEGWEMKCSADRIVQDFVFTLSNFMVYGKKEEKDFVLVPASWKDHLKVSINKWSEQCLEEKSFFFTNIARAIKILKLKPKLDKIITKTIHMRYCPHVDQSNRNHIEYLQFKEHSYGCECSECYDKFFRGNK